MSSKLRSEQLAKSTLPWESDAPPAASEPEAALQHWESDAPPAASEPEAAPEPSVAMERQSTRAYNYLASYYQGDARAALAALSIETFSPKSARSLHRDCWKYHDPVLAKIRSLSMLSCALGA